MIKFLVMDVDGTLTDGKIYMGSENEIMKAFNVKDGFGIKEILPKYDILPVVITGRCSLIVKKRCEELGIINVFEGIEDKKETLKSFLYEKSVADSSAYSFENVAFIGDDLPDLSCIVAVRDGGGICGCPNDADSQIKKNCTYISTLKGGEGAVREFIEYIINNYVT